MTQRSARFHRECTVQSEVRLMDREYIEDALEINDFFVYEGDASLSGGARWEAFILDEFCPVPEYSYSGARDREIHGYYDMVDY